MTSRLFTLMGASALLCFGCAQSGVTPKADAAANNDRPAEASGGATNSGGATASGGAVGSGGATASGGATGSGGETASGGALGNGGATGNAGATGNGGATASAGGRGGTTMAGGAGAGGMSVDETIDGITGIRNTFMSAFKDSWILFPCYGQTEADCITNAPGTQCPTTAGKVWEEQGLVTNEDFKVGGVPGKMYKVTIRVNGISEAKYYMGGVRAAGTADPANANAVAGTDTFHTGGAPVEFENYNIYAIRSKNMAGTEIQHYYLNSFPMTNTPYEYHQTFPIAFTHDITAMGGGTITIHVGDRNCHAIDNCGIGFRATGCAVSDGRAIPNETAVVIPTMYMGKVVSGTNTRNGAAQPFHSQAIHITVTAVAPM